MNLTSLKNWKTVKLGDVSSLISRGVTPVYTKEGGIVILNQKCIRDWKVSYSDAQRTAKFSEEKLLKNGDVLICSTGVGTLGRVAQIHNIDAPVTVDSHVSIVRPDPEKVDQKFLGYFLKKSEKVIEAMAEGSTGQTELSRMKLKEFEFQIPESPTDQKEITAILGSLDDKIELLHRENKTLESMAQAMFKEWFVDFNFPGKTGKMVETEMGEVPEGWKVESLTKVADFLNGVASQKYQPENKNDSLPVIKIKEMKSGITMDSDRASKDIPKEYIVKNGDLLFSWSGSLDVVLWNDIDGLLNQHLFKVTSKKYPKWFYYYWVLYHLPEFRSIAESKATTMGHIQRHHLDDAKVSVPDQKTFDLMNGSISSLLDKQILNNSEMKKLASIRDSLLNEFFSS